MNKYICIETYEFEYKKKKNIIYGFSLVMEIVQKKSFKKNSCNWNCLFVYGSGKQRAASSSRAQSMGQSEMEPK